MDTVNQIWEQVLEYIRPKLSPIAFDVYIKCMDPKSIEDGEMVVTVRTDFLKNNIVELYSELLLEAHRIAGGQRRGHRRGGGYAHPRRRLPHHSGGRGILL